MIPQALGRFGSFAGLLSDFNGGRLATAPAIDPA
jgi:hypothetical protein